MTLFSADAFQIQTPAVLLLLPPGSPFQWPIRLFFLALTFLLTLPALLVLISPSVIFLVSSSSKIRALAPLPIHPTNLPPHFSALASIGRGIGVYFFGAAIWSITGFGNAPENYPAVSRWLAKMAARLVEAAAGADRSVARLEVSEDEVEPVEEELRIGIMALKDVPRKRMAGFWLRHVVARPSAAAKRSSLSTAGNGRRVYLFLSGGGYVTGWPLVHPFVFSLARTFPPESPSRIESEVMGESDLAHNAIFAPDVQKSLSLDRSFPSPVLDALAGYVHLREMGYQAEEIVLMGDSAGAGLCWSLVAYLAVFRERGSGELGIPGGMVMISPWLSLPPTPPSLYPDTIDEPQLLNAARCYLARFPVLKHRPDPFSSDWNLVKAALDRRVQRIETATSRIARLCLGRSRKRALAPVPALADEVARDVFDPKNPSTFPRSLDAWLDEPVFIALSSHHPFISPGTDTTSPFVVGVLDVLAENGTRVLLHHGTAEWFYAPAVGFARGAKERGVDVEVVDEVGGYHIEACLMPGEWGGAAVRLVDAIFRWDATNRGEAGSQDSGKGR